MAIHFLGSSSSSQSSGTELPWVSEFLEENPDKDKDFLSPVQQFVKSEKGILVVSSHYKAFLFAKSDICVFLEAACEKWSVDVKQTSVPGIFLTCEKKARLAFDDQISDCFVKLEMVKKSWKRIIVSWGKPSAKSQQKTSNPFLL